MTFSKLGWIREMINSKLLAPVSQITRESTSYLLLWGPCSIHLANLIVVAFHNLVSSVSRV